MGIIEKKNVAVVPKGDELSVWLVRNVLIPCEAWQPLYGDRRCVENHNEIRGPHMKYHSGGPSIDADDERSTLETNCLIWFLSKLVPNFHHFIKTYVVDPVSTPNRRSRRPRKIAEVCISVLKLKHRAVRRVACALRDSRRLGQNHLLPIPLVEAENICNLAAGNVSGMFCLFCNTRTAMTTNWRNIML